METKISDLKSEGQLELGTHADTSVAVLKHWLSLIYFWLYPTSIFWQKQLP